MADTTVKLIADLPTSGDTLTGSELLEIQVGSGVGASQKATATKLAQIALRQSVQTIVEGSGDASIDNTDPNHPILNIPKFVAGDYINIDDTDPLAPIIEGTSPVIGGIQAAYGSPGGDVLQSGNLVQGIATASYRLTGWKIQCSPVGSIVVDLLVGALGGSPSSIIGTGNAPTIAGAASGNANSLAGWTSVEVDVGSVIQAKIKSVSAVQWFSVAFLGVRI